MRLLAWNIPPALTPPQITETIERLRPDLLCLFGAPWSALTGHPTDHCLGPLLADQYVAGPRTQTHATGQRWRGCGVFASSGLPVAEAYLQAMVAADLTAEMELPPLGPALFQVAVWPTSRFHSAHAQAEELDWDLWPEPPISHRFSQVFAHCLPDLGSKPVIMRPSPATQSRLLVIDFQLPRSDL